MLSIMKTTIFTAPDCPYCTKAKALMDEVGIEYVEINVREDLAARDWMVEKSGQKRIPVIFSGSEIIIGFTGNEDKIRALCQ